MRIGIMGIGNIFSKAYLPIITQMQDVDWHLYSRDEEKLSRLSKEHGFKHTHSDRDEFFAANLDAVMIHTPTFTHYDIIKDCLTRGIHVFVDKPISDEILKTYELIQLANDLGLILMTGFNRRYAPFTKELQNVENKSMIMVSKNREMAIQEQRFALYDMMIHVVDTALSLLDDPVIEYQTKLHLDSDDHIISANLSITTNSTSLYAYMNMKSGARLETFEVMSHSGHYIVNDMNTLTIHTAEGQSIKSFTDWTPTLEKRGFPQMINEFIRRVGSNDNSKNNQAILSHEIIEDFLK